MRIAFLGLGVMGRPMAGHLRERFGDLAVWNRTASKADGLVEAGATRADSPAAAAEGADVVCLCLADTPDVEAVVFGEQGVYQSIQKEMVIVDFSTISADATEDFAGRAGEKGAMWLDAPVSGGDVGARKGTLTIMVGGPRESFDACLPVFETVGKTIRHMGPVGSGQRTKMANQIAVCGTLAAMAEAMNFARESGMDVAAVLEVIGSGAAGSWTLQNYGPRVLAGDFDPGFAVRLMAKDLRLVTEALEGKVADYETMRRFAALFAAMTERGDGGAGIHAVVRDLGWKDEG